MVGHWMGEERRGDVFHHAWIPSSWWFGVKVVAGRDMAWERRREGKYSIMP